MNGGLSSSLKSIGEDMEDDARKYMSLGYDITADVLSAYAADIMKLVEDD